jgi:tetratricopeptide (TPR) repeat protein
MSKAPCALILSLLTLAPAIFAQQQAAPQSASSKPDYSQEAFVIEQTSTKFKFENDGTYIREDMARVRIQSDAGVQRFGLLTFSYEDATGTIEIDYVKVRKPDGTVVVTPPENIQDMAAQITREAPFYSDLREKQIAVKGLGIGDVLEFDIHHHITKPLAPGQFWMEYSFTKDGILLQEQLEISLPRDRAIKLKTPAFKPTVTDADKYRVYAWTASNLKHKDDLETKRDRDKAAWEQARGRFPQPDVLLSSFQSWEEVGRWYGSLQQERVKPTSEIRAKASELTKDAPDDNAKLQATYKFVSTKFRYIGVAFGIARYQPHSASDVLDNQYGDCKDKHTLLASLLGAAGINAYPALISSTREIDPDVPSPGQFDHVITAVSQARDFLWLDSTTEVGPFQYLAPNLRNKHALVIQDDRPVELVNTPAELPFRSTQTFRMKGKLNEAGVLEGNATFTARGDLEFVLRAAFRSVPLPNWKDLTQRVSYGFGFAGDVSDVTAGSPEKTDEPFQFKYKYTRKDFGDWPNHRILAAVPAMSLPTLNDETTPPAFPMWLGSPSEVTFHSEIELPSSYIPTLPSAIHEKQDFAQYDSTYSFKNGALIADRRLLVILSEVPSAEFEAYKNFRKIVEDDYNSFIPLYSGLAASGTPAPAAAALLSAQDAFRSLPGSSDPEATRLENDAKEAIQRKDTQGAISSLYRALGADPKFTRAWLILGGLLMSSHQIDAALDAFHKAIAADPKQPVAYKVLGYSLMQDSKFEDALPVWQNLIKAAPEDADGPTNLGSTFLQLKRYPEAVSALEAALKLSPDRPDIQRILASAYTNAGDHDKAAAMFQKVLQSDSHPQALNNVAFEIADAGKDLPLALQYAEKALRTEEADSQNTTLSQLKIEDLEHTPKIAAYWDTLGWIHSQMSHLDQAEKYLNAAWMLTQDGLVASHLCEVYAQLHKTQAAIHMCQIALYRLPLATIRLDKVASVMKATQERLTQLGPTTAPAQNAGSLTDETSRMRNFKLARLMPGNASADFFVLLVADSKAGFRAQDAKFISGSEKLKSSGKILTAIDFKLPSPDGVPTRLVRRGILGCYQYTGCSFVLLDPGSVHSLK